MIFFGQDILSSLSLVMPDFSVTCRRLTPGPGYLEALQEENVRYNLQAGVVRTSNTQRRWNSCPNRSSELQKQV